MVEPPSASQQQSAGYEHQHHYQQHQHDGHPPQHYHQAQQQVYPQSQQGLANSHIAPYRLSSSPVSSLYFPFTVPSREGRQIQLARSHCQLQQQQAMRASTHGQELGFQQQEEAVRANEAGWREEVSPPHRMPLLPSLSLFPAPLLDEVLLQDRFVEEGRAGGAEEEGEEDKEEAVDFGLEEEEDGGEQGKAGSEDRNPPLPVPHMDSFGYPWTSMEQQRGHDGYIQQHQQYQQDHHYPQQHHLPQQQQQQLQHHHHHHAAGGVFSMSLGPEKTEDAMEEGGMHCAPCLPSLTSPFSGPAPFFHEGMQEAVFAGNGTNDCAEAEVWRGGEKSVEGGTDREERRMKKRKEGEGMERGDPFVNDDEEVLDLFKDGDIDNW